MGCIWNNSRNLNILDIFWVNQVQMKQSVVGRCLVGGVLQGLLSLVNDRGSRLECATFLDQTLFLPLLMYDSETIIWRKKERSRFRAVQMDNLRGLLGIMRVDARIRDLCEVTKC